MAVPTPAAEYYPRYSSLKSPGQPRESSFLNKVKHSRGSPNDTLEGSEILHIADSILTDPLLSHLFKPKPVLRETNSSVNSQLIRGPLLASAKRR